MIRAQVQLIRNGFTLDVDFTSNARVLGVFGPSGAGKTTLINLIAGLEQPTQGSITIDDQTLFDSAARCNIPAHQRHIGVVFQEHRLFPHMSVEGNLRYGAPRQANDVGRILELLELTPFRCRRIHQLSGGERQRVALGRALLSQPRLLLLDEPLASLDKRLRQQIIPYLRRVRDELNVPMVYVSHELAELLQLADELLIVEQGKVVGQGPFADIIHNDAVLSAVHDRGMTNVIVATVVAHNKDDGITTLAIGTSPSLEAHSHSAPRASLQTPTHLLAPLCNQPIGSFITIAIQPWDIALATAPVTGVSIQNQLPGNVTRCTLHERRALVEVNLGARVIVEVSKRSAAGMNLAPGSAVVCLIKSHAVQYV